MVRYPPMALHLRTYGGCGEGSEDCVRYRGPARKGDVAACSGHADEFVFSGEDGFQPVSVVNGLVNAMGVQHSVEQSLGEWFAPVGGVEI